MGYFDKYHIKPKQYQCGITYRPSFSVYLQFITHIKHYITNINNGVIKVATTSQYYRQYDMTISVIFIGNVNMVNNIYSLVLA